MLRLSKERGHFDFGWLKTYHTFSFSDYYDPNWMEYRTLRVINEDTVQPSSGFPTHPHKDMEILTYVYQGAVAHKDSMGNVATIKAGEFQIMSAGSGITHSEYNPSDSEVLKLMQIWIRPNKIGIKPRYEQRLYGKDMLKDKLKLIVSADGREDSLVVNQDVAVYTGLLERDKKIQQQLDPKRYYWLQIVDGTVSANNQELHVGDGFTLEKAGRLDLRATDDANIILFDLA